MILADITHNYGRTFYDRQREGSVNSPKVILLIIFDLVKPKSVVDFGFWRGDLACNCKTSGGRTLRRPRGALVKTQTLADAELNIREQPACANARAWKIG
jgi:hypothetical protein